MAALGKAELPALGLQGTAQGPHPLSGDRDPPAAGCVAVGLGCAHCPGKWCFREHTVPCLPSLVRVYFCSPVETGFSLISFLCCHIRRLWLSCLSPLPDAFLFLLQTTLGATAESSVVSMSFIPLHSLPGPVQMLSDPTPFHQCLCRGPENMTCNSSQEEWELL